MNDTFQKDAVGVQLEITLLKTNNQPDDVSAATGVGQKVAYIARPGGTHYTAELTFKTDGKDGKVVYTSLSGHLSEVGHYTGQVVISYGGLLLPSKRFRFYVEENVTDLTP